MTSTSKVGAIYTSTQNRISKLGHPESTYSLSHEINYLVLNESETLLAAYGNQKLSIIDITTGNIRSKNTKTLKKIEFHPAAYNDACVVGLSDDGVHLFSPCKDTLIETQVPLCQKQQKRTVSLEDSFFSGSFVSFCFGLFETGPLAMLLTTSECDIYALCPLAPDLLGLTSLQLELLSDHAVTREDEQDKADIAQYKCTRSQLAYVYDLRRQAKTKAALSRPPRDPSLQGPASLAPYPSQLYNDTAIAIVSCQVDGVGIIAQLTDKHVVFYVAESAVDLISHKPDFCLNMVECVPLSGHSLEVHEGVFFVHNQTKIFVLEPLWIAELANAMRHGPTELSRTKVSSIAPSYIIPHIGYVSTTPIAGSTTTQNWSRSGGCAPPLKRNHESRIPQRYEPLMEPKVSGQITALAASINVNPALVAHSAHGGAQALEEFAHISQSYWRELANIYKAIVLASSQVDCHKSELRRQLVKALKAQRVVDSLGSYNEKETVSRALDRQKGLLDRVSKLSRRVESAMAAREPSVAETEFAKELEGLKNRVSLLELEARSSIERARLASQTDLTGQEENTKDTAELHGLLKRTTIQTHSIESMEAALKTLAVRLE